MRQPGRTATILLALTALTACDTHKKRVAEYVAADKATAAPPEPERFDLKTSDATVALVLPHNIDVYPELHKALFDQGRQNLLDFVESAKDDRAHDRQKGRHLRGAYERRITWTISAITPHLISLKKTWFDDTGGAHPNHGSDVYLWDRLHNQPLLQADLFKPGYDFRSLDQQLCEAITAAKTRRMGPTDPKSWTCPKWADSRAAPVPSVRPYRIGGLMFLFDPYAIGAYAEGDYQVLIPLAAFQDAVAPAWAEDFTGSPSPAVKPNA